MDSISQREMRNNSGEVLRRVAEGESMLVTNNGVPAAVLSPVNSDLRSRLISSGRLRPGTGLDLSVLPTPVASPVSSDQLIEEDRGQ